MECVKLIWKLNICNQVFQWPARKVDLWLRVKDINELQIDAFKLQQMNSTNLQH